MDFDDKNRYLLVCGTTKAATTSLFNYLKGHPDVAPCFYKESRFFIDEGYPVVQRCDHKRSLDDYCALFQGDGLRLEATPDYLHSVGTPQRLKDHLADFKIVLLLRDPVDRFFSWYRFAQQNGDLPADTTLNGFINMQCDNISLATEQYQLALIQGQYIGYLQNYFADIDRKDIFVGFFEDLSRNPLGFAKQICEFADIDSSYYDDYAFETYNATKKSRSSFVAKEYKTFKKRIRHWVRGCQGVHASLVRLNRLCEALIYGDDAEKGMNREDFLKLKSYYEESVLALKNELGLKDLPWENFDMNGQKGLSDER